MDAALIIFSWDMREFRNVTCKAYPTSELVKQDGYARRKRPAPQDTPTATSSKRPRLDDHRGAEHETQPANTVPASQVSAVTTTKKVGKQYSLNTLKFHAFGDICRMIRLHGASDSYNTQIVRHCHQYPRCVD